MRTVTLRGYAWNLLPVDIEKIAEIHRDMVRPGNQYKLGAKIPVKTTTSKAIRLKVDCSGYVRWILERSRIGESLIFFPDGSVVQHDAIKYNGFKHSSPESALHNDGILRIAFLEPVRRKNIGHVALILNGGTIESAGGTGADTRHWTLNGWRARAKVYVLAIPPDPFTDDTDDSAEAEKE